MKYRAPVTGRHFDGFPVELSSSEIGRVFSFLRGVSNCGKGERGESGDGVNLKRRRVANVVLRSQLVLNGGLGRAGD